MNSELKFTIKRKNGKTVTINCNYTSIDDYLYRGKSIIRCDCDLENPSPYKYDKINNIVYCPVCNNQSINVTVFDETNEIYLYYIGVDYNTMQKLYKLSDTIPYQKWVSVSDLFFKVASDEVDLEYPLNYIGWVTSVPELVEEVLNIQDDYLICNRDVEQELLDRVNKTDNITLSDTDKQIYYFDIVDKLHELFSVVETPYGEFEMNGKVVNNPLFPPNDYGRGECWVIDKGNECIWFVMNNYRDGDNLQFNNVLWDGALKCIGKCIPFDVDVEELILQLLV